MDERAIDTSGMTEIVTQTTADVAPIDAAELQAQLTAQKMLNEKLQQQMAFSVPMILQYQQPIWMPPAPKEALWQQACSNDKLTSDSWRDIWLKHIENNVAEFDADNRQVGQQAGAHAYRPAVCCGSGPSLKKNVDLLRRCPSDIPIISCLHNFGAFVDRQIPCKYFVSLDAGEVVVPEMGEGGSHPQDYYTDASKDYTLIAGLVTPPALLRRWKGPVYFFNATIPDPQYMDRMPKLTKNRWVYSVGGNTFGAVCYHAAWIFGCNPLALVGADFAFDYMHKFHSWDSQYDAKFGGLIPCTDVFGNRVYAWPSYQNFRAWFEFQSLGGQSGHHVQLVNCTEGGTLGAYPEGNVISIKQQRLAEFLDGYIRWQSYAQACEERKGAEYVVMW